MLPDPSPAWQTSYTDTAGRTRSHHIKEDYDTSLISAYILHLAMQLPGGEIK